MRSISDAFFNQRPDPLRWIQLRRVGWQAEHRDSFRHLQSLGAMRGRAVPDQHKALTFSGVRFGELVEKSLHTRGVESRQHEPENAPRSWMSRSKEPQPFVTLINDGKWPLSLGCPDAAQDGLEAEARFIFAPDFYFVRRIRLLKGLCLKFYLFLNSACPSTDARRLFAGRGT